MIRKCFVFTVDHISEVFKIQKNDSISILFLVTGGDNRLRRLNSDDTIDIVANDGSEIDAAQARASLGLPNSYKASINHGDPPTVQHTIVNQLGTPTWSYNPTGFGGYGLTIPGAFLSGKTVASAHAGFPEVPGYTFDIQYLSEDFIFFYPIDGFSSTLPLAYPMTVSVEVYPP